MWPTHLAISVVEPDTVVIVSQVCGSIRRLVAGSTSNLKCPKKSTPIMGNETAASRKVHWKPPAIERQCKNCFTPTRDDLSSRAKEGGAKRGHCRMKRENKETGPHVHEKKPLGILIHNVDKRPRGDSVETSSGS